MILNHFLELSALRSLNGHLRTLFYGLDFHFGFLSIQCHRYILSDFALSLKDKDFTQVIKDLSKNPLLGFCIYHNYFL